MPRYKLTIEYDGSQYAGWQKQPEVLTIQEAIEQALRKFCQQDIEVMGAGRTDAGVHATAQVAHIDIAMETSDYRVMQGINYYLFNKEFSDKAPENRIAVISAQLVADDFHARFSATKRHYLYRIINRRARLGLEAGRAWLVSEDLDAEKMQAAANLLIGNHDFTSFRDTQCQAKSPIKTLDELTVQRYGCEIQITTSARSFLHHQVRNMAGTLALVGKGKWQVADVQKALQAKDRRAGGPTAPPDGLYLTGVDY